MHRTETHRVSLSQSCQPFRLAFRSPRRQATLRRIYHAVFLSLEVDGALHACVDVDVDGMVRNYRALRIVAAGQIAIVHEQRILDLNKLQSGAQLSLCSSA
jgi:hypothetical protein